MLHSIDRTKTRFAAGTSVFGFGPCVDAFEAEAVSAPGDGGEFGQRRGAIEADGAGEVGQRFIRFGWGFLIDFGRRIVEEFDGLFFVSRGNFVRRGGYIGSILSSVSSRASCDSTGR